MKKLLIFLTLIPCFAFSQTYTVSGRVTNEQGEGISNIEVRFYTEGALNSLTPDYTCLTDTNGDYDCDVTDAEYYIGAFPDTGSWYAMAFYSDTLPSTEEYQSIIVDSNVDTIDFHLVKGGKIKFTIYKNETETMDTGLGIHVYRTTGSGGVWWDDRNFNTSTGIYESSILPPGNYKIAIFVLFDEDFLYQQFYCGTTSYENADLITINSEEINVLDDCILLNELVTYSVTGTVKNESSELLQGVMIETLYPNGDLVNQAVSNSEGKYTIQAPEGEYIIKAVPSASSFYISEYFENEKNLETSTLLLGEQNDIDFILGEGGKVQFSLLDAEGGPLNTSCYVGFLSDNTYYYSTEIDGSFSANIPEGNYYIVLTPNDGIHLDGQGFCNKYNWQSGELTHVVKNETLELGTCNLIADIYEPVSSEGYLFGYDQNWIMNHPNGEDFSTSAVAIGDLNGDTLPDIVVSAITSISSEHGGEAFPADIIAVLENKGNNMYENNSDSWVPFEYYGAPRDIEIGDMDCDGRLDLLLGCTGIEWTESEGILWGEQDKIWRNTGNNSFEDKTEEWMPYDSIEALGFGENLQAWYTHAIELSDFNNDGFLDIVRGTAEPVLLNVGNGQMKLAAPSKDFFGNVSQTALGGAWGIDVDDLNSDGKMDMVWVSSYTDINPDGIHLVFLGEGDGTFFPLIADMQLPALNKDTVAYQPVIDDFNNDGLNDIFIANVDYGIYNDNYDYNNNPPFDQLFFNTEITNDGYPVFDEKTENLDQDIVFNKSWHATSGDIDCDGDSDILVSNLSWGIDGYEKPELKVFLNDGKGSFSLMDSLNFPSFVASPTQIILFDSDLDGDYDLYLGNGFPTPILLINLLLEKHDLDRNGYVQENDYKILLSEYGENDEVLSGDLNEDGKVDTTDISLILRYHTTTRANNDNLVPKCGME